jgi:Transposase DDE domain
MQFAAAYRERGQIELFFKALKQNLKIKTFVGTSANAVRIQIWTALIAILLLKILQFKSTSGWALSNLGALLRWHAAASLGTGEFDGQNHQVPRLRLLLRRHHGKDDECSELRGRHVPGKTELSGFSTLQ